MIIKTYDMHFEDGVVSFPKTFGEFEKVALALAPKEKHGLIFCLWLHLNLNATCIVRRDRIWYKMLMDKEKLYVKA